jgi:hypothetical protein
MKPVAMALLVVLSGCATTATMPVEYLLRPPLEERAGPVHTPPIAALGRVSIAPYLDRKGIVLETAEQRIHVALNHRWAEPLSQSLRRMLQVGVSRASGTAVADVQYGAGNSGAGSPEVIVDVDVYRFHGSQQGRVILVADWQLRDPRSGRVLGRHEFVQSTLTDADGYDALVRAHIALLEQLSGAIAATLRTAETLNNGP